MTTCDVAIIGAGPAGIAAAIAATEAGLGVIVLDEAPAPGGQIYRGIDVADARRLAILGPDYAKGARLVDEFRRSGATHHAEAVVWNVGSDLTVDYSRPGGSTQISAGALIVASGAVERAMPMPGWTLPGVTTVGAIQILLNSGGVVAEDAVLTGSGPLLWLVASQLVAAGAPPRAVVETVPRRRYLAASRHVAGALRAPAYLRKGIAMMLAVRRAGVRVHRGATGLAIEGTERVAAVRFASAGRTYRIETDAVALHEGVVPNQQITRLLRCEHAWNEGQRCFVPVLDDDLMTSVDGVYVAGDGAGIGGADSAVLQGRLAALSIAARRGVGDLAERDHLRRRLSRDRAVRPLLEALYAPCEATLAPADETIVCRCEEITAGQIRHAVDLGAPGPNQVKSFLRAGMGPCQGRVCGLAVTQIIAARRGETPAEVGYYRIRPPLKPLALAELAALERADV